MRQWIPMICAVIGVPLFTMIAVAWDTPQWERDQKKERRRREAELKAWRRQQGLE